MAMSANAVLMKFFKLPPAVRMMLALAGFGSLASILYTLLPALRSKNARIWILVVFGIGILLFLLIWGIRRLLFGRKSSQLSDALESQGPSRGEIAEQEQIYREKFRGKLSELKSNGLSVYKLPWFVLMGEPGCGKTASLIHSGLDFPLGKDEVPGFGGTRNYNWWFANEGVILDTAGRIAFHEEGTTDKVEWEYFCKLLKQNRPRCPINGIVIALPADKLLRDSSEERAQKATVLRERLRQIHQLLGVRFPTFILVTKMDLVGGFSEYFEEIRVDLQQRNQMVGWSRPGEFQEPFDPADFAGAFEEVHERLRAWSMRYLQRKATDDELGMIVTFPEAFRELETPLNDYISTVFQKSPLLEPPFFRGFYFTSAVQEGAPILDVFARTTTAHISEQKSKAVDSKAFFIHDFYANKVFPEHGLVFRSAKHVSLNQRMRRMVWVGSAAMLVLMLTFFGFGWSGTRALVERPKQACVDASEQIEARSATFEGLAGNIHQAKELQGHYEAYNGAWNAIYAKMLFIGANIRVPQEDVGAIHSQFVMNAIVRPVLDEAGTRLRNAPPGFADADGRARYMSALKIYAQWYGEVVGRPVEVALDGGQAAQRRTEFEQLLRFVDVQGEQLEEAATQFEISLEQLAGSERAFARDLLASKLIGFATGEHEPVATDTLVAAVRQIQAAWLQYANLEDNADEDLRYWRDFATRIAVLRERYGQIMAQREAFTDGARFQEASTRYLALTEGIEHILEMDRLRPTPGTLNEAWYELLEFLRSRPAPETPDQRIRRLRDLLQGFAQSWGTEFAPIEAALAKGAPARDMQPQERVYSAIAQSQADLATAMNVSLNTIREQCGVGEDGEPLDYYRDLRLFEVIEASPPALFNGEVGIAIAREPFGPDNVLLDYLQTLRGFVGDGSANELDLLPRWPALIRGINSAEPSDSSRLSRWFSDVRQTEGARRNDIIIDKSHLSERMFWRPVDLYQLAGSMRSGWQTSTVEALLVGMQERAEQTVNHAEMPGLARLMPGYAEPSDLPFVKHRFNSSDTMTRTPAPDPEPEPTPVVREPDPEPEEQSSGFGSRRRRGQTEEPAEPAPTRDDSTRRRRGQDDEQIRQRTNTRALLARYHEMKTLHATLIAMEEVNVELARHPGGQPVMEALDRAAAAYLDGFYDDWEALYGDYSKLLPEETLSLLEKLQGGQLSWPEYVAYLRENGTRIGNATGDRFQALVSDAILFDAGLPASDIGDRVFSRIDKAVRDRLPYQNGAMANDRNWPDGSASPAIGFAGKVGDGWGRYVSQVVALGPLTDDNEPSSNVQPDSRGLANAMITKQAFTADFPLIAPLVDIAAYSDGLLVDHLNTRFSQLFQRAGGYPIGSGGASDPAALVQTLKAVLQFKEAYGELYARVGSDAINQTFAQCEAWIRFLYGPDVGMLSQGALPPAQPVTVGFCRPGAGTLNIANVYGNAEVTVPLLEGGAPAPAQQIGGRGGGIRLAGTSEAALSDATARRLTWNVAARQWPTGQMRLFDLNARAKDKYPAEQTKQLGGGSTPWSVLQMLRSNVSEGQGRYRVQPRITATTGEVYGIDIVFQFPAEIPSAIVPFQSSSARPRMSGASKYLTGR